ncbi:MAG: hypothetical protein OEL86_18650 [Sulfuritalea sp.]|nr:hypothetical protein [Sulfuritalea sp.]
MANRMLLCGDRRHLTTLELANAVIAMRRIAPEAAIFATRGNGIKAVRLAMMSHVFSPHGKPGVMKRRKFGLCGLFPLVPDSTPSRHPLRRGERLLLDRLVAQLLHQRRLFEQALRAKRIAQRPHPSHRLVG